MSRLWSLPSAVVLVLVTIGPLGAYLEVLSPAQGFYLFGFGILAGAVSGLLFSGAAAFASLTGRAWRGRALRSALIPLGVTLAVVVPRLNNPPPILNDVTTDLADPPQFELDVAAGPGLPVEVVEQQKLAYPELQSLVVPEAPAACFTRVLAAARAMPDWEVITSDSAGGVIRAVATRRIFRFRDDVVIRIRPEGAGSKIDLRSRSRVGRGDMGANAARILAYQDQFRAASP